MYLKDSTEGVIDENLFNWNGKRVYEGEFVQGYGVCPDGSEFFGEQTVSMEFVR